MFSFPVDGIVDHAYFVYNKNFLSLTILQYMAEAVRQPSRRPEPKMREPLRRERGSS